MEFAPVSATPSECCADRESVDENGKPIGILTLGVRRRGLTDFVITDKAADIIIEAMHGIKDAIKGD